MRAFFVVVVAGLICDRSAASDSDQMAAFTAQQHMHAPIAVAHPRLANLSDPLFEERLSGATGFIVIGRRVEQEHMTRPADRYIPVAAHLINELALPDRVQSLRRSAS